MSDWQEHTILTSVIDALDTGSSNTPFSQRFD